MSPQQRTYNETEQTTYIINSLRSDTRLTPGINYVQATIEAYQRDSALNPMIQFPIDLHIDEIAVIIDDRSPAYAVGDNAESEPTFNVCTNDGLVRTIQPYIRTFGKQRYKTSNRKQEFNPTSSTTQCKCCFGIGHCVTNNDQLCFTLAKAHLCLTYIQKESNKDIVIKNTAAYVQKLKDKARDSKRSDGIKRVIRKMEQDGVPTEHITPMISLAQAMDTDSDDKTSHNGNSN